jgi:type 1 glutamine amidotransferase
MQYRAILYLCSVLCGVYMVAHVGRQGSYSHAASSTPKFAALVFTKTTGWRHESIPAGISAIQALGAQQHFAVHASEDAAVFTRDHLARYRVVIFLNTTGDILDAEQQAALEGFIRQGGGFVGIHSATDTEYDWPWYGRLVGAYFANHPAIQTATIKVVDATHPSTRPLPATWSRQDEWYNFRAAPPPTVRVLLSLDETSYTGGSMGDQHPIAWYHRYDSGRAWYTAMGHTTESYHEPLFLQHILGGIMWAAGATTE